MKRCTLSVYFFCMLSFLLFSCETTNLYSYYSNFHFTEVQKNEEQKNYHKILIVGSGAIDSRILFEEITGHLSKDLSKKSVICNYLFLSENENKITNEQLHKEGYDALFTISANNGVISTTNEIRQSNSGTLSTGSFTRETTKLYLRIFDAKNLYDEVWMMTIDADINPRNKSPYALISKRTIESFIRNKIIKT